MGLRTVSRASVVLSLTISMLGGIGCGGRNEGGAPSAPPREATSPLPARAKTAALTADCSTNGTPVADGTACDDGNPCTRLDSCQAGTCVQSPTSVCTGGGSNVTFYQSYDHGTTLDIAGGSKTSAVSDPLVPAPGLFGVAADWSTTPWLLYNDTTGTSADLAKPGSLSYWMKVGPQGLISGSIAIYDIYTHINLYAVDNGPTLGMGALIAFAAPDGSPRWAGAWSNVSVASWAGDDKWHLIVINWSTDYVGVSVDGAVPVRTAVDWQEPDHVYDHAVGSAIYMGGSLAGGGATDEFIILNRPMTAAEIQWYYNNGRNGGQAGANPAIAYFSTGTACNPWEDLNPCTIDACDPATGGVSHAPAMNGITCSNGNACNSGAVCSAGVCTSPAPQDDGNSCTVDSCDPLTQTIKNDPLADGTVCDDGDPTTILTTCQSMTCQPKPEGPNYAQLIDLGMVNPGDVYSYANGINASGDVVGEEDSGPGYLAFRYTNAGHKQQVSYAIPNDLGVGINASGTVVGYSISPDQTTTSAFIADPGAAARALFSGSANSIAYAINDAGQVVGVNDAVSSYGYRLSGGPGGTLLPIPAPAGADFTGVVWAEAIGPGGEVVGSAMRPDYSIQFDDGFVLSPGGQLYNAFRYTDSGGTQNLNDYAVANGWQFLLEATATNGSQTVGWGVLHGHCHAFRHTAGTNQVLDLGTLSSPEFAAAETCTTADTYNLSYYPRAINSRGEIVGFAGFNGDFYYNDNIGMVNLQEFVDPALGITLAGVAGINDNDEVAGDMYVNGALHVYRMKLPTALTQPVTLRMDGIVDTSAAQDGSGPFVAVFGYDSQASASYQSRTSVVFVNGAPVDDPHPAPPQSLSPGTHPGTFLPTFTLGQTVAWQMDGQVATASVTSGTTFLSHQPIGPQGSGGYGVLVPGAPLITIESDLNAYKSPPQPVTLAPDPTNKGVYQGMLSGSLSVGPSGNAIYTVPIPLPSAVAGMAPALALTYDSQGPDGIAGQGWDLTGLSAIYRCPKTRVQDGYVRPVMMDDVYPPTADDQNRDGLCIDGKRLFIRQNGTIQLEMNDFSNTEMLADSNGGEYFVITTKSGERRYYGHTPASRVQGPQEGANGVITPSPKNETAIWALDRVMDQWGNYYDVQYNGGNPADFAAHGIRVTRIDYTGYVGAESPPDQGATFYSVTFNYADRFDVRHLRFRDLTIPKNSRLTSIETPQGLYSLTYHQNDNHNDDYLFPSQLDQIAFCAHDDVTDDGAGGRACAAQAGLEKAPLVFGWQRSALQFVEAPGYAVPVGAIEGFMVGTQYVDIDGDGRLDLIWAKEGTTTAVWQNTGDSFQPAPSSWLPPVKLFRSDGVTPAAVLADMDGDGMLDLVADNPTVDVNGQSTHYSVAVFLNRFKQQQGWQIDSGLSVQGYPFSGLALTARASNGATILNQVVDMNGDGRADIVQFTLNPPADTATEFFSATINSTDSNGNRSWTELQYPPGTPLAGHDWYEGRWTDGVFHYLYDVNRDGLPDLIPASSSATTDAVLLNTGALPGLTAGVWSSGTMAASLKVTNQGYCTAANVTEGNARVADLDGDGLLDQFYYKMSCGLGANYSTGSGYSSLGWSPDDPGSSSPDAYVDAMLKFDPPMGQPESLYDYTIAFADLNGDGLADMVQNRQWAPANHQGMALINDGTTFRDVLSGRTAWSNVATAELLPQAPPLYATSFIDLDGDGLVDVAGPEMSWLNKYQPPVINSFPNALANSVSSVTYKVTTTKDAQTPDSGRAPVYTDTANLDSGTKFLALPQRVVATLSVDDGTGNKIETDYAYSEMRTSAFGRGPLGFKTSTQKILWDFDLNAPGGTTVTTYAQAYPYTGRTRLVVTSHGQQKISTTETTYCDSVSDTCTPMDGYTTFAPPSTSLFVYPSQIIDTTPLHTSDPGEIEAAENMNVTSTFQYDNYGNPTQVAVRTVLSPMGHGWNSYSKTVTNSYGDPDSREQKMGKVTFTKVHVEQQDNPAVLPIDHHTSYEYNTQPSFQDPISGATVQPLAMTAKTVEPDPDPNGDPKGNGNNPDQTRQRTVFSYDGYGNVKTTTECASDFDQCRETGRGTVPFRITRISYDPAVFDPAPAGVAGPVSSLADYGRPGRFPVQKTISVHGIDHVTYTAYDPRFGTVVQETDPNGVQTYHEYDKIGREIRRTDRYGTSTAAATETHYYIPPDDAFLAALVTQTHPATGADAWVYSDILGRTILTKTRALTGGWSDVLTQYSHQHGVWRVSKPYFDTDPGPALWRTTNIDVLGRPYQTIEDLGVVDPASGPVTKTETTTYQGSSTLTTMTTTLNGDSRSRQETKNALGKVAVVTDDSMKSITYSYDPDGNLTGVSGPGVSMVASYDSQGRKRVTSDLDVGYWTYTYDGFGQLVSQKDAKQQITTMTYDEVGRVLTKTDANQQVSEWVYDRGAQGGRIGRLSAAIGPRDDDGKLSGPCPEVPFVSHNDGNRAGKWFTYTDVGNVQDVYECVDGETFHTSYEYDSVGRQSVVRYPQVGDQRFAVQYSFTPGGALQYISDVGANSLLWVAKDANAAGQVTDEVTGNGVETISARNPATGWLMGSTSVAHGDADTLIQAFSYTYDESGNLKSRSRTDGLGTPDSSETFQYDNLDRLTNAEVKIPSRNGYDVSEVYKYDGTGMGNLVQKGDKIYSYGTCGGPHAVCQVTGSSPYVYDANGSLQDNGARSFEYDALRRITHIDSHPTVSDGGDSGTIDFIYGADGNRVLQVAQAAGASDQARTVYVGLGETGKSIYERTKTGASKTEHVHFVYAGTAGGSAIALRVVTQESSGSTSTATNYNLFDHLGSTTASTDDSGRVNGGGTTILSFDAWGKRRSPDGSPATAPLTAAAGHREYTGQEAIPNVGLINMNGRVYDPELGRFLVADTAIQTIGNLQSYNRYSYVQNNPLRYTDHTGHFIDSTFDAFVGVTLAVAGTAVCLGSEGLGCGAMFALIGTAYATSSAIYAGIPVDQALIGGIMSGGAGFAGGVFGSTLAPSLAQGIGGQMIGGFIGGAVAGAFANTTQLTGPGELGSNILHGGLMGALSAAYCYGVTMAIVSQNAGVDVWGDTGGAGENIAEQRAREQAAGQAGSLKSKMVTLSRYVSKTSGNTGIEVAWKLKLGIGMKAGAGFVGGFFVGLLFDSNGDIGYDVDLYAGLGEGTSISLGDFDPVGTIETKTNGYAKLGIDVSPVGNLRFDFTDIQADPSVSIGPEGVADDGQVKINAKLGVSVGAEVGAESSANLSKALREASATANRFFGF